MLSTEESSCSSSFLALSCGPAAVSRMLCTRSALMLRRRLTASRGLGHCLNSLTMMSSLRMSCSTGRICSSTLVSERKLSLRLADSLITASIMVRWPAQMSFSGSSWAISAASWRFFSAAASCSSLSSAARSSLAFRASWALASASALASLSFCSSSGVSSLSLACAVLAAAAFSSLAAGQEPADRTRQSRRLREKRRRTPDLYRTVDRKRSRMPQNLRKSPGTQCTNHEEKVFPAKSPCFAWKNTVAPFGP